MATEVVIKEETFEASEEEEEDDVRDPNWEEGSPLKKRIKWEDANTDSDEEEEEEGPKRSKRRCSGDPEEKKRRKAERERKRRAESKKNGEALPPEVVEERKRRRAERARLRRAEAKRTGKTLPPEVDAEQRRRRAERDRLRREAAKKNPVSSVPPEIVEERKRKKAEQARLRRAEAKKNGETLPLEVLEEKKRLKAERQRLRRAEAKTRLEEGVEKGLTPEELEEVRRKEAENKRKRAERARLRRAEAKKNPDALPPEIVEQRKRRKAERDKLRRAEAKKRLEEGEGMTPEELEEMRRKEAEDKRKRAERARLRRAEEKISGKTLPPEEDAEQRRRRAERDRLRRATASLNPKSVDPEVEAERRRRKADRDRLRRGKEVPPEVEEERRKRRNFAQFVKRASMTEEAREAARIQDYFRRQAYYSSKRKQRYRVDENRRKQQKEYMERMKADPEKLEKIREQYRKSQKRKMARETPEQRLRRLRRINIYKRLNRLRNRLYGEGVGEEEIETRAEELRVILWKRYEGDGEVTPVPKLEPRKVGRGEGGRKAMPGRKKPKAKNKKQANQTPEQSWRRWVSDKVCWARRKLRRQLRAEGVDTEEIERRAEEVAVKLREELTAQREGEMALLGNPPGDRMETEPEAPESGTAAVVTSHGHQFQDQETIILQRWRRGVGDKVYWARTKLRRQLRAEGVDKEEIERRAEALGVQLREELTAQREREVAQSGNLAGGWRGTESDETGAYAVVANQDWGNGRPINEPMAPDPLMKSDEVQGTVIMEEESPPSPPSLSASPGPASPWMPPPPVEEEQPESPNHYPASPMDYDDQHDDQVPDLESPPGSPIGDNSKISTSSPPFEPLPPSLPPPAPPSTSGLQHCCSHCPRTFKFELQLRCHLAASHADICWKCPKCLKVMISPEELSEHYQSSHPGSRKNSTNILREAMPPPAPTSPQEVNFLCMRCPPPKTTNGDHLPVVTGFKRKEELFSHVKAEHPDNYWPCERCQVLKYSDKALQLHLRICSAVRRGKIPSSHSWNADDTSLSCVE